MTRTEFGGAFVTEESEMKPLSEIVRLHGFKDEEEFHHMVSSADFSTPEKIASFKHWQLTDGTREGLAKLQVVRVKP